MNKWSIHQSTYLLPQYLLSLFPAHLENVSDEYDEKLHEDTLSSQLQSKYNWTYEEVSSEQEVKRTRYTLDQCF